MFFRKLALNGCVSLLVSALIASALLGQAGSAAAQTPPDPTVCAQQGGSRLCAPPLIGRAPTYDGNYGYYYQRCNSTNPYQYASEEAGAISGAAAAATPASCSITGQSVGVWPTPAVPAEGDGCIFGSHVWPQDLLGIESGNRTVVHVTLQCQVNGQTVASGGDSVIFRYRDVVCPPGYETRVPNGPDGFLCAGPIGIRCLTCYDNYLSQGNPINAGTQTKYEVEPDFKVPGSPLEIVRYYNSRITHDNGSFGSNWRYNYDRKLKISSATVIHAQRHDGAVLTFWLQGGTWATFGDISRRFSYASDPTNPQIAYALRETDDSVEYYSAGGVLLSIVYRGGQTITFSYGFHLTTVTDSFGRTLRISASADSDHIDKVRSITAPDGSVYVYEYKKSPLDVTNSPLGNPSDPANPGDPTLYIWMLSNVTYPGGAAKGYVYNEFQNIGATNTFPQTMTGVVDENGARYATFKYTGGAYWGMAIIPYSTEHANGVDKFTVGYGTTGGGEFTFTNPLGRTMTNIMGNINSVPISLDVIDTCLTCTGTVQVHMGDQYDNNRNVSIHVDPDGRHTKYQYDLARNLESSRTEGFLTGTTSAGPLTRTTTTAWHPTFRLPVTITEPLASGNRVSNFTYDGSGNLTQRVVTTPQGSRTWNWTYDAYGRVLTATDPRGKVSSNSFYPNDPSQGFNRGLLASVTNAAGQTTTIGNYNANGQPLSITDANGLTTTLTYDVRMRLASRNVGGEITSYSYDLVGQLLNVTLPEGSTLAYTYDDAHRLVQIADGLGNRIIYTLDNMGNRTREDVLDPLGQLARTHQRAVNARGAMEQDIGGASGQTTQYVYDFNGNWLKMTDPQGRITARALDDLGRMKTLTDAATGITQYQYDPQDNLTKVIDPKSLATNYTYNGFNEMVSQQSPDTGTTSFTYDLAGNLLTKTDARGVTSTYSYDSLNRVSLISYPDEMVIYNYDTCTNGNGRLCSFTDKTGVTSYGYDNKGRVVSKAQNVAGVTQSVGYTYNAAGQMSSMTLPSGSVLAYTYGNNRLTGISLDGTPVTMNADYEPFGPIGQWDWGNSNGGPLNQHIRYFDTDGRNTKIESGSGIDPQVIVYDAASRITDLQRLSNGVVDPARSLSFFYDNLDRLVAAAPAPGSGSAAPSQSFVYDAVGNRTNQTFNGVGTTYNYNYSTTGHRLNSVSGGMAKSFGYDAVGNKVTDGAQTWTYGANNRPTQIALGSGLNTVNVFSDINALGQRVRKTVPVPGGPPDVTRFVYDEAGRLIGEYRADGTPIREHIWFNDLPVGVVQ